MDMGLLFLIFKKRAQNKYISYWDQQEEPLSASRSEAGSRHLGVGQEGGDGPVAACPSDDVAHHPVEFGQLGRDVAQVPFAAHQSQGARPAQRLVAEVNAEQGLDLVLRGAAENVVGPRYSGNKKILVGG